MNRKSRWMLPFLMGIAPVVALAAAGAIYTSEAEARIAAQQDLRNRQAGNQGTEFGTVVYEVAGPWRDSRYTYTPVVQGNADGVNLWPSFDSANASGTAKSTLHTHNDPGSYYNGLSPEDRANADLRGIPTYAIEPGDGFWADCVHEYDPETREGRSACDDGEQSKKES